MRRHETVNGHRRRRVHCSTEERKEEETARCSPKRNGSGGHVQNGDSRPSSIVATASGPPLARRGAQVAPQEEQPVRLRKCEQWVDSVSLVLTWLVSMVSMSVILQGLSSRSDLHSSRECEMTWSRPKYLVLKRWSTTSGANNSSHYRLLKFVDRRDLRFHHLYDVHDQTDVTTVLAPDGADSDQWCRIPAQTPWDGAAARPANTNDQPHAMNRAHPVLFIPGHWGEFQQARSLGAHGTGFTRQYHSAAHHDQQTRRLWNAAARQPSTLHNDLSDFFYDVYTMDFAGEGGAIHGSRLFRQTEAVAVAVQTIAEACNATHVTLVGHSIGGLVARALPILFPSVRTRGWIHSIITLATPHEYLPYAWDSEMHRFYQLLNHQDTTTTENHVAIISISGGLRDELIPPITCQLSTANGLTVLTSMLPKAITTTADGAPQPTSKNPHDETFAPSLGVDHKGIVWCHDVLSVVRDMIFLLHQHLGESWSPKERLDRVRRHLQLDENHHTREAYLASVKTQEDAFSEFYGCWRSTAIKATMWYTLVDSAIVALISVLVYLSLAKMLAQHVFPQEAAAKYHNVLLHRALYLLLPPVVKEFCSFFLFQRFNLVHHLSALVISYTLLALCSTLATVIQWWRGRASRRRQTEEGRLHEG